MSEFIKQIEIQSKFYKEGRVIKNFNTPSQCIEFFINQIEILYENDEKYKRIIDSIIKNSKFKKNYFGSIHFLFTEEELNLINSQRSEKEKKQYIPKLKGEKDNEEKNNEIHRTIFLKEEIKKKIQTIEHPFLSAKKNLFIISNSRIENVKQTITYISELIKSEIKDFDVDIRISKKEIIKLSIEENKKMEICKENHFYNKILFGPTGTGKSNLCNKIIKERQVEDNDIFRITFYEDYSYYDFFGQYKPIVLRNSSNRISVPSYNDKEKRYIDNSIAEHRITYQFVPGIFFKALMKALYYENIGKGEVFLVIEEINRGNCSSIFGDIFQLLDRDNDGKSSYCLTLSDDLRRYLLDRRLDNSLNIQLDINENYISEVIDSIVKTNKIYIPQNLILLATMNTSDQSLFPIDSAFKRRWTMQYSYINYKEKDLLNVEVENSKFKWLESLALINNIIYEKTNSEDKQIGQWFIKSSFQKIRENDFKDKIIAYLYFDVFKHYPEVFQNISYSKIANMSIDNILETIEKSIKE